MAKDNLKVEKQEVQDSAEPTRPTKLYVPDVDIIEGESIISIVADMPGVDEKTVDITLEKNVLTLNAYVEADEPDNYNLAYAEYESGGYRRSFTLSDEIDQDNVEASMSNGVLHISLPKAVPHTRKIAVKAV